MHTALGGTSLANAARESRHSNTPHMSGWRRTPTWPTRSEWQELIDPRQNRRTPWQRSEWRVHLDGYLSATAGPCTHPGELSAPSLRSRSPEDPCPPANPAGTARRRSGTLRKPSGAGFPSPDNRWGCGGSYSQRRRHVGGGVRQGGVAYRAPTSAATASEQLHTYGGSRGSCSV